MTSLMHLGFPESAQHWTGSTERDTDGRGKGILRDAAWADYVLGCVRASRRSQRGSTGVSGGFHREFDEDIKTHRERTIFALPPASPTPSVLTSEHRTGRQSFRSRRDHEAVIPVPCILNAWGDLALGVMGERPSYGKRC